MSQVPYRILLLSLYERRAETRALIGGCGGCVGGTWGEYSYIRVLPNEFLLKSVIFINSFPKELVGQNTNM